MRLLRRIRRLFAHQRPVRVFLEQDSMALSMKRYTPISGSLEIDQQLAFDSDPHRLGQLPLFAPQHATLTLRVSLDDLTFVSNSPAIARTSDGHWARLHIGGSQAEGSQS